MKLRVQYQTPKITGLFVIITSKIVGIKNSDAELRKLAEVVGSNPTRSISLCEGNTAYFDFNLDICRAITLAMPDSKRY
jgi:hypothetical protein